MARYLVNDIEGKDPRSLLTVSVMNNMLQNGLKTVESQWIRWKDNSNIEILPGVVIAVSDSCFKTDSNVILNKNHLDTGSEFEKGKDYYIYICDPQRDDQNEIYKISLNSTYPSGYTASNSRKIGGFHYGTTRKINQLNYLPQNATNADWGSGWETQVSNGILQFSVWCLTHRSAGLQDGMCYIPSLNKWVSIYLLSMGTNNTFVSKYNVDPLSGSNGLSAYDAIEMMRKSGLRPLTFHEFMVAAEGSPNGQDNNTYAWTSSGNTTKNKTGIIPNACSIYGLMDCVGNLWELGIDTILRYDWIEPIQSPSTPPKTGGFNIYSKFPFSFSLHGGGMKENVYCSSRALYADTNPWIPSPEIGFRGIADHKQIF